jgi:hypothetical protein
MGERKRLSIARRKLIWAFASGILLVLSLVVGVFLYYYYHPDALKVLIEKSVTRSYPCSVEVESLSYSLRPLALSAEGVAIRPRKGSQGPLLEISRVDARAHLEGSFGHKTLTFETLDIEGFSLQFSDQAGMPDMTSKEKTPSHLSRFARKVLGLLIFRDIHFESARVSGGRVSGRLGEQVLELMDLSANLDAGAPLVIQCGVRLENPSLGLKLSAPRVQVTTDQAISLSEPRIKCQLETRGAFLETPLAEVNLMAFQADLDYDHDHSRLFFQDLTIRLEGAEFRQDAEEEFTVLPDLELNAEGRVDLEKLGLDVARLTLEMKDRLQLTGQLKAVLQPWSSFKIENLNGHIQLEKLPSILPSAIRQALPPLTMTGRVDLAGSAAARKEADGWHQELDAGLRFKRNSYAYQRAQIQIKGSLSGSIQAKGTYPGIKVSARMNGENTLFSSDSVVTDPFHFGLSLEGEHPLYRLASFRLHVPGALVAVGKKDIQIRDITLRGSKGTVDVLKRSMSFPEIGLDSSLLKNLSFSMKADGHQALLKLHGKNTGLSETVRGVGLLPSSWQVSGDDTIEVEVRLQKMAVGAFNAKLTWEGLGLGSPDGSLIGEKISSSAEIRGEINLRHPLATARVSTVIHGGEMLYDRFYLDLNGNPFLLECECDLDFPGEALKLAGCRVGLKDILVLDLEGSISQGSRKSPLNLSLSIRKTDVKPLFRQFVLEPFQVEKPFLNGLNIGGSISANLRLTGTGNDWQLRGRCRWDEGQFEAGNMGFSFRGIDLDLPLWLQTSATNKASELPGNDPNSLLLTPHSSLSKKFPHGSLSIQSAALPFLSEQSLNLPLTAKPNQLFLAMPVTLKVSGGDLEFDPVQFAHLLSGFSVETGLSVDLHDIRPFLSEIWSKPPEGSVKGKLQPIRFEKGALSTRGEIEVKTAGGEIVLYDLGAEGLFTPAPLFMLNGRINDLSLTELTQDTTFGKIEGSIQGTIRNLHIAYGQPQRFDLFMETVEKEDQRQRISVRAVDNIARIGGGQSPFMGVAGTFASFFREFPYDKIGIRASLENDVFRVNGTIKEGGKEYLVKRSGFSGVDVVNQNPDNLISFKDMVKRIKRISAPGASPVVK